VKNDNPTQYFSKKRIDLNQPKNMLLNVYV